METYRVWVHLISGDKFEACLEPFHDPSEAHEAATNEAAALTDDNGWSDVINGRVRNRDISAISYSLDEADDDR